MTQEISVNGIKVSIAIPCYSGYVPLEFSLALAGLVLDLRKYGVHVDILSERENGIITQVRNKLLYRFLHECTSDYLFWIDDDIIFKPADFIQILALTTINKSSAATYCTRTDDNPVFFMKYINGETPEFTEDGLIKTKGLGLGFACQHRSVLEPLEKDCDSYLDKDGKTVKDVFKVGAVDGQYQGEDINFFERIYNNGQITYVHPFIHLKHVGRKDYDHRLMKEM